MREQKTLGRPREFDEAETLRRILDVFWTLGFEGTSLSDLMDTTGLQKGSLYAAFGDKRAMYLKALALYESTAVNAAVAVLTGRGSAAARIGKFLQAAIDPVVQRDDRRGCFLCNASVDQAVLDDETQRAVKQGFGRMSRALEQALTELGVHAKGRAEQAQHFLSVYFGLRVLAKGGQSVKALRAAKAAAMKTLD